MFAALFALVLIGSSPAVGPVAGALKTGIAERRIDTPAAEQSEPAALAGVSVRLECTAFADGQIRNCVVLEETRPGLGFGAAAVALMDGSPVGPDIQMGRAAQVKFEHTIQFTPD
ncbi:hypothetical protein BH10PSE1_BH10PSE1_20090 [soil metagenome]